MPPSSMAPTAHALQFSPPRMLHLTVVVILSVVLSPAAGFVVELAGPPFGAGGGDRSFDGGAAAPPAGDLLPVAAVAAVAAPYYPDLGLRDVSVAVPPVARRADGCAAGQHSCLDINSTICCTNDRYCLLDPNTLEPACCLVGSSCGSPCNAAQYACNATTTVTTTRTAPSSSTQLQSDAPTVTAIVTTTTTSVFAACCGRRCPGTSMFLCASTFGGGCCSFGQTCASHSQCIWTTNSNSNAGGGGGATGSMTGITTVTGVGGGGGDKTNNGGGGDGGGSLSGGAKAGIALGVVVGAAALIGAATWLCLHRRWTRRGSSSQSAGGGGVSLPGGAGAAAAGTESDGGGGHSNRLPGLAQDYVGPDAVAGPYTDPAHAQGDVYGNGSGSGSGAGVGVHGGAGGAAHGVPMRPHGPRDIVAPVEIDSTARGAGGAAAAAAGSAATAAGKSLEDAPLDPNDKKDAGERRAYTAQQHGVGGGLLLPTFVSPVSPEETVVHYELYGSEVPVAHGASSAAAAAAAPAPAREADHGHDHDETIFSPASVHDNGTVSPHTPAVVSPLTARDDRVAPNVSAATNDPPHSPSPPPPLPGW
ncbi:hypothetical protein SPI_08864 [Niveomyces insectorum RCEF 264]|uniref:Uncharacterized protein n=1 Tax=Niveomyces insectorum RCEF 264 TaxID=1081102 RepID=A0A162IA18_9HYPO|nr:hypothetical protein SPI_08864 [Niveomyces insectorum RCEF 264]